MDYRAPFELVDRLLTKKYSFKRISFEETWRVMPAAGWENGKMIPLKPEEKTMLLRTEEVVDADTDHVACYWLDDPEVFKKYTDMSQHGVGRFTGILVLFGLNEKKDETENIYIGNHLGIKLLCDLTRISKSNSFGKIIKEKSIGEVDWE